MKYAKNSNKFGLKIFLSLGVLLLLVGGIAFGTELVQQNQENRSNAASNDESCLTRGGECQVFSNPKDGDDCNVDGWAGYIKSGLCAGNSKRRCCMKYGDAGCKSLGGKCEKMSSSATECVIDGQSGDVIKNKCGGDSTVRCCVPKGLAVSQPVVTTAPTEVPVETQPGVITPVPTSSETQPVVEQPTPVPTSPSSGGGGGGGSVRLSVATFNIGHANKTSKASSTSIAAKLKDNNFDIAGLQEVDKSSSLVSKIADKAGMTYFHTATSAGNSVVTTKSLSSTSYVRLTDCGNDAFRAVQKVVLKVNNKDVSFYNAHIDFNSSCRRKQTKDVIDVIKNDSNPWILVGDFNFGLSGCTEVENLFSGYSIVGYDRVNNGTRCTDLIIIPNNQGVRLISAEALKTRNVISDHNLVSAIVEIN